MSINTLWSSRSYRGLNFLQKILTHSCVAVPLHSSSLDNLKIMCNSINHIHATELAHRHGKGDKFQTIYQAHLLHSAVFTDILIRYLCQIAMNVFDIPGRWT